MLLEAHCHPLGVKPIPPWVAVPAGGDLATVLDAAIDASLVYLAGGLGVDDGAVARSVVAATTHLGITTRFIGPHLAQAVLYGPQPVPRLHEHWWQPQLGSAFPLSVPVLSASASDEVPSESQWVRDVMNRLIEPLLHMESFASVPQAVRWSNVASALNGLRPALQSPALRGSSSARETLASTVASRAQRLPALLLADQQLATAWRTLHGRFIRRSCCAIYRLAGPTPHPDALCADCPIVHGHVLDESVAAPAQ